MWKLHLTEARLEGRANGFVALAVMPYRDPRSRTQPRMMLPRRADPQAAGGSSWDTEHEEILSCNCAFLQPSRRVPSPVGIIRREQEIPKNEEGREGRREGRRRDPQPLCSSLNGKSQEEAQRQRKVNSSWSPAHIPVVSQPLTAQSPTRAGQLCTRRSALTVS